MGGDCFTSVGQDYLACGNARRRGTRSSLAQVHKQQVAGLRKALDDPALHDEGMALLRGLIERVGMQATGEGYEVALIGEIAPSVASAENRKPMLPPWNWWHLPCAWQAR